MNPSGGEEEYDFLYKIVLVGDSNVGKTNLISRYIKNTLPKNSNPTIGVEFATRVVPLKSGGTVKAQIWDTAGQERYYAIVSAHYRRAIGALLVYDVTSSKTFLNAEKWIKELKSKAEPDIVIMLVGNKVDLVEKNPEKREVSLQQAETFASKEKLLFTETSAVTSHKVKEAFETLLEEIYKGSRNKVNKRAEPGANLDPMAQPPRASGCCS